MNKHECISALAVAFAVALKVLALYGGLVFCDYYISDEYYYVTASSVLISRLLNANYTPPYTVEIVATNGTMTISVSVDSPMHPVIIVPAVDWRNLEHPGFAKLVYGLIHHATGSLQGLRLTLLALSAAAYGLFAYAVVCRYRLKGVFGLAVFILVDRLAIHYTYLAFLDTLMNTMLLLACATYLLGKRRLSLAFLSLSAMCKIPGVVPAIAFAGAEYRRSGLRSAVLFIVVPAVALVASYGINLMLATPGEIATAVLRIATLKGYTSCSTPLCLFAIEEEWGVAVLSPVLIWLWILVLFARALSGESVLIGERNLPLNVAILSILFTVATAAVRAIYVFYYLTPVALAPVAVAELVEHLYHFGCKKLVGRMNA